MTTWTSKITICNIDYWERRNILSKEPRFTSYEELPAVLSIDELKALLHVSKNTAYELVRSKRIPSIRAGRQIRITKSAVMDFLSAEQ